MARLLGHSHYTITEHIMLSASAGGSWAGSGRGSGGISLAVSFGARAFEVIVK